MPKRTNEFQSMVYLMKRCLAEDASVEESAFLTDPSTGEAQEVDVVLRAAVAGHDVLVSVECVDRSRPANIEWIDQMHGKHSRLPTNVLVLVSKNGFTARALKKAKSLGIETVRLDEPPAEVAARLRSRLHGMRVSRAELVTARFNMMVQRKGLPEIAAVPNSTDFIFLGDGEPLCDVDCLLAKSLEHIHPPEGTWERLRDGETEIEIPLHLEEVLVVVKGQQQPVFLKATSDDALYRIVRIDLVTTPRCVEVPLDLELGQLGSSSVAWGQTQLLGDSMLVVMSRDADGPPAFSTKWQDQAATGEMFVDPWADE